MLTEHRRIVKAPWGLAVSAVLLYCLISFFFWNLIDVLTPFVAPLLWVPIFALAMVAVISAIFLPVRHWKNLRVASLLPLLFLITAFIVTRFLDFTELWLAANFRLHYADRAQVVGRIERRELGPQLSQNHSLVALPKEFAGTSMGGGEVVIQRDGDKVKVLFFTFRGVLDSFAGFVYASDGSPPKDGDFLGRFFINKKIKDRWYYVSAH